MAILRLEFLPELVVSGLAFLWLAWAGRVFSIAAGRRGGRDRLTSDLSRSDVQLLKSLHIRP